MQRSKRWGITVLLLLSMIFLAGEQPAEAARSLDPSPSAQQRNGGSDAAIEAEYKGTVKPPPGTVLILVTGSYSVGGFCVLNVILDDPAISLDVRLITPLPDGLPATVHKVRQGCLLTYYSSGERIAALPEGAGETRICFAALPKKQMTVYYHDTYSPDPVWVPLETTVEAGNACAPANSSGTYVATFLKE